jgi:hypothetical protein
MHAPMAASGKRPYRREGHGRSHEGAPRVDRKRSGNFGALSYSVNNLLTPLALFAFAHAPSPQSSGTTSFGFRCQRAGTGTPFMFAYHITKTDSRVVVCTEEEPILICASLKVAHQVVADAKLLETIPAKQIFSRRVPLPGDE